MIFKVLKPRAARYFFSRNHKLRTRANEFNFEKNELVEKILVGHPKNITIPKADILVANILQNPLKKLLKEFSSLTKSGGHIILSGLLAGQAKQCLVVYETYFNMNKPVLRENWASLHGVRL